MNTIFDLSDEDLVNSKLDIEFIHKDLFKPGNFILCLPTAIISSPLPNADGGRVQIMVGNATRYGYREGEGINARFNALFGIVQTTSGFIVTDYLNHCLRLVEPVESTGNATENVQSWRTSTYAGECRTRGHTNGNLRNAKFFYPRGIVRQKDVLFIAESKGQKIRQLHMVDNTVYTIHESLNLKLHQLVIGKKRNEFYLTVPHGVIRVQDRKEAWVVGSTEHKSQFTTTQFTGAGFDIPRGIAWLTDKVLLVADFGNHLIKLVDLESQEVTVICPGMLTVNTVSIATRIDISGRHKTTQPQMYSLKGS